MGDVYVEWDNGKEMDISGVMASPLNLCPIDILIFVHFASF